MTRTGEPSLVIESADSITSVALQEAFFADIAARYPGWTPESSQPLEASELSPPGGVWLVAYLDGQAVGCGGLQALDSRTGEIRRIFVSASARGRGTGRALLSELEVGARKAGYDRVRLTTGDQQPEAVRLFLAAGYQEIPPFTRGAFTTRWMEKVLD